MRLSDAVGHSGLAVYAEVALVIFFLVFVGVVVYVFARGNKQRFERARRMPLDDERPGDGPGDRAGDRPGDGDRRSTKPTHAPRGAR